MVYKQPIEWPIQSGDSDTAYFDLHFGQFGDKRYVAATLGDVSEGSPLVRIESACIFGHVFSGVHCDCGIQWQQAIKRIIDEGKGILIYSVDDDARGHGIETHFELYVLRQYEGRDDEEEIFESWNEPMDIRDYTPVIETLEYFDVDSVKLMTNNPERVAVLEDAEIDIVDRIPLEAEITEHNYNLLLDEKEWMDYDTSYRTHDEWRDTFQQHCEDGRGFMLVAGQQTVVTKGFGPEATPSVPESEEHDLLTLYVTPSMPDTAVESVSDAVYDVIEVETDQVQAAATTD